MNKNINDNLTSQKINQAKKTNKILTIVLIAIIGLLTIIFLISAVSFHFGDFTVNLDRNKNDKLMSIYDNRAMSNPTTRLSGGAVESMDAMALDDFNHLDVNIDDIDGSHNGDNYFAYTFYLKNVSTQSIEYEAVVNMLANVKGVDEAVRIMMFSDSTSWGGRDNVRERIINAKLAENGEPEPGTAPFPTDSVVYQKRRESFMPNEVHKYTLIIYLEGTDPECDNKLQGGTISFNMKISTLN